MPTFRNPYMETADQQSVSADTNDGRTPTTDIIVGLVMILLSTICALAYSLILHGIYRDKDLLRMTSYKFMFTLGVVDVIQCFPHAVTGLFTIFQTTWHYNVAKAMGVLATPCYVAYATMTVILSFNRFIQLASTNWDRRLFGPKGVKVWIGLTLGLCILYMIALGFPYASIVYFPDLYSWDYDHRLPYSWLVQRVEMFIEIGGIFISAFFYFLVLFILYRTRRQFRSSTTYIVELKILVQALVITVYCTILNVFWHNYSVLLPANLWSYMGLNFMWICNSGIYPLIYFIVNKTIREKVRTGGITRAERSIASRVKQESNVYVTTSAFRSSRPITHPASTPSNVRHKRKRFTLPFNLSGKSSSKAIFFT